MGYKNRWELLASRDSTGGRLIERYGILLGIVPVFGALLSYALALIAYRPYGVTPADVGIQPLDLVAPTVALAIPTMTTAFISSNIARRALRTDRRPPSITKMFLAIFGPTVVVALVVKLTSQFESSIDYLTVATLIGGSMSVLVLPTSSTLFQNGISTKAKWFLITAIAVGVMVIILPTRQVLNLSVNNSATPFAFSMGPVTRFVTVTDHTPGSQLFPSSRCMLTLGDGPAGRVILVAGEHPGDRATVHFVDSQLVSIASADRCAITLPRGAQIKP